MFWQKILQILCLHTHIKIAPKIFCQIDVDTLIKIAPKIFCQIDGGK